MKHLLFLLLPFYSVAQEAPKHTTTIIVNNTSFDKVGNALVSAGYHIEADERFQTIKTEWLPLCDRCAPEYSLYIRVKDSTATITGEWRTNAGISMYGPRTSANSEHAYVYPIRNDGIKLQKAAFESMNGIASTFGSSIMYR